MKVINDKSNKVVLELTQGSEILFSYGIPVAYKPAGLEARAAYGLSKTTNKHINEFTGGIFINMGQEEIELIADALLKHL